MSGWWEGAGLSGARHARTVQPHRAELLSMAKQSVTPASRCAVKVYNFSYLVLYFGASFARVGRFDYGTTCSMRCVSGKGQISIIFFKLIKIYVGILVLGQNDNGFK